MKKIAVAARKVLARSREPFVAGLYAVAGALITIGTASMSEPVGFIIAGVCVAAWTFIVFAEL